MSRPWKHPKTGMYWVRKRVPDDLRAVVGKREEKRSLRTKDPVVAKERFLRTLAAIEARWQHMRLGKIEITEAQAHQIARPIYDQWIEMWKGRPSEQRAWSTEMGVAPIWDMRPIPDAHHYLMPWYEQRLDFQAKAFEKADELVERHGLTVDETSRKRIAIAVTAALQRASVDLEQLALGRAIVPSAAPTANSEQPAAAQQILFDELVRGWAAEKQPAQRTVYEWTRVVAQLKQFVGYDDAGRLTSSELNKWKASLIEAGLRPKTIRDAKLAPVRAMLQWAVDNEKLRNNPASRVVMDVKSAPGKSKRSFTDEEATRILNASAKQQNSVLRWVPWLCAFTGARVAEICQLRKEDVFQESGVWCAKITPDAGSIKNAHSERAVPIHSSLLAAGFIDFANTAGSGPLFPQITPTRFGSRGGNGTKIVGRWVRGLGIEDERISPNHSWRHRFKTLARRHGLAAEQVDALLGHRPRTVGSTYGEFEIEALKREIEKIPTITAANAFDSRTNR